MSKQRKPVGRRKVWDGNNPEHVQRFIDKSNAYFDECDLADKPYTVTGLCLFLGMSDKNRLYEMCKRDDELAELGKQVRTIVEQQCEERLCGKFNPGDLFKLKNMGWSDQQQIDVSLDGNITLVTGIPESDFERDQRESEENAE